jgi:hypothetical protein
LGSPPAEGSQSGAAPPAPSAALYEILRRHDVTDVTPEEFAEMIQELYEAGAITEAEFQQLAAIRLDLDAAGLELDDSVDLLEFYSDKIEDAQREPSADAASPSARRALEPLLRRFEWIEKFALVQSASSPIELDALA